MTSACEHLVHENEAVLPDTENQKAYAPYYEFFLTLYPALKDRFSALAQL